MQKLSIPYQKITTVEHLLCVWGEFLRGKRHRADVSVFQMRLIDNLLLLSRDLRKKTYRHGSYYPFRISDPKPRSIHKATVRDRVVHHLLYQATYEYFDKRFVYDSYSCRVGKGAFKAIERFQSFTRKVSRNHTRTCWVLKCDIRQFFASIDHSRLGNILRRYTDDENLLWLLGRVIDSFTSTGPGKGLPLGNLTSQLLVNVYMNEFDRFVKEELKEKYYIRYADDFVFVSEDKDWLISLLPRIDAFLKETLLLTLHPNKVSIATIASGIDFLGWIHFPDHRVLRTSTKRRMFKSIRKVEGKKETVQSYLGLLGHGNSTKLKREVINHLERLQHYSRHPTQDR